MLPSRAASAPVELTGPEIVRRGLELAKEWSRAPEGGVVLLLLPHSVELFLLHFGLILSGRLPAILAWPTNRVDPEKYQRNLLHQLRYLPAAELLTLPRLAANLDAGLPYRVSAGTVVDHEQLEAAFRVRLAVDPVPKREQPPAEAPKESLFLQFSGGTTGAQKCIVVTAGMLEEQLTRLNQVLTLGETDGVVSWLPMYHDMGLIACLWFPIWFGCPSYQFGAVDWLLEPDLLFREMARDGTGATFCWLPNFAFSYLAGARERMRGPYNLEGVRAFINCSEPVRQRSMESFISTFSDWGVRREQLQASYAMAETVFAVTQSPLERPLPTTPKTHLRGREARLPALAYGVVDDVYVSSGRLLPGMQVRIRGENGALCPPLTPGGIEILAPCLFSGYWGNEGFLTYAFAGDGWYASGDFGFLNADELYVIGRTKDIVIVGGQNIFPEDAEAVANTIPGVYPGRVVAFGVEDEQQGTESLVVVAEMRGSFAPQAARLMEQEIQRLVLSALGIAPRFVKVVPERWIVKSTAGKISRKETRQRFLEERQGEFRLATPAEGGPR